LSSFEILNDEEDHTSDNQIIDDFVEPNKSSKGKTEDRTMEDCEERESGQIVEIDI
jgi:hypothetical protein